MPGGMQEAKAEKRRFVRRGGFVALRAGLRS